MSDGLSGCRDSDVIHDPKYRLAQEIIDDEEGTKTDLGQLPWNAIRAATTEVAGTFFGGTMGAAGHNDPVHDYNHVWSTIVTN